MHGNAGQPIAVWILGTVFITDDGLTGTGGSRSDLHSEELKFAFGRITQANSTRTASWSLATNSDSDPGIPSLPAGLTLSPLPAPAPSSLTLQLAGGTATAAVKLLGSLGAQVMAACFIIDLPDLGGAKRLAELEVPVRTLVAFPGH